MLQKKPKPENVSPKWAEGGACLFSNHHVRIPALDKEIYSFVSQSHLTCSAYSGYRSSTISKYQYLKILEISLSN